MIYAALYIAFYFAGNQFKPDVVFCDQVKYENYKSQKAHFDKKEKKKKYVVPFLNNY
jgi:hypothetical protein